MYQDPIELKLNELIKKVEDLKERLESDVRFQDQWVDKTKAMKILECSERTLQTLRDKGKIGRTNPLGGKKFFYLRKDIDALFNDNFKPKKE